MRRRSTKEATPKARRVVLLKPETIRDARVDGGSRSRAYGEPLFHSPSLSRSFTLHGRLTRPDRFAPHPPVLRRARRARRVTAAACACRRAAARRRQRAAWQRGARRDVAGVVPRRFWSQVLMLHSAAIGKARSRLALAIERKALAKVTRTVVLTGQTPHAAATFFFSRANKSRFVHAGARAR